MNDNMNTTEFENTSDCSSKERVEVSDKVSEVGTSFLQIEDGISISTFQVEEECATEVSGEASGCDTLSIATDEGTLASANEDMVSTEDSIMNELSKLPQPTCKMIPGSYFPDVCSIKPGR